MTCCDVSTRIHTSGCTYSLCVYVRYLAFHLPSQALNGAVLVGKPVTCRVNGIAVVNSYMQVQNLILLPVLCRTSQQNNPREQSTLAKLLHLVWFIRSTLHHQLTSTNINFIQPIILLCKSPSKSVCILKIIIPKGLILLLSIVSIIGILIGLPTRQYTH